MNLLIPRSNFCWCHLRCVAPYPVDVVVALTAVKSLFGGRVHVHKVVLDVVPAHVQHNQCEQAHQAQDDAEDDIGWSQLVFNVHLLWPRGTRQSGSAQNRNIRVGIAEAAGTNQCILVHYFGGVETEPPLEAGQLAVAEEGVATEIDGEVLERFEVPDDVLIDVYDLVVT